MKKGFIIFSSIIIALALFLSACSPQAQLTSLNKKCENLDTIEEQDACCKKASQIITPTIKCMGEWIYTNNGCSYVCGGRQPYDATTERKYIGNSVDECSRIKYMCVDGMQSFSDETGCGCEPKPEVFCTEDAKLCDDGSSVGRDPNNNCEFFACPDVQPVANKFYCNGKSYDVSEPHFCSRALLVRGKTCIIRDEGDIIIDEADYKEVQACVDQQQKHANTFFCSGNYYDTSEVGTCARIKLTSSMACVETEFGDLIIKSSQEKTVRNCIMTCGNDGPKLSRIDENGVHSCTCSIEGMSCDGLIKAGQCGNGICDEGEANDAGGCGPNADPRCLGPPARAGTCPQDCPVQ